MAKHSWVLPAIAIVAVGAIAWHLHSTGKLFSVKDTNRNTGCPQCSTY